MLSVSQLWGRGEERGCHLQASSPIVPAAVPWRWLEMDRECLTPSQTTGDEPTLVLSGGLRWSRTGDHWSPLETARVHRTPPETTRHRWRPPETSRHSWRPLETLTDHCRPPQPLGLPCSATQVIGAWTWHCFTLRMRKPVAGGCPQLALASANQWVAEEEARPTLAVPTQ